MSAGEPQVDTLAPVAKPWRFACATSFVYHAALAAVAWWLLPHGFPPNHIRFWTNDALLVGAIVLCAIGFMAVVKDRVATARFVLSGIVATYAGFACAWLIVFPQSVRIPALIAGLFAVLQSLQLRRMGGNPLGDRWAKFGFAAGAAVGIGLPWSQQGPMSGTRPAGAGFPELAIAEASIDPRPTQIPLTKFATLATYPGSISARLDRVALGISPLFSFEHRSHDRGWVNLARTTGRKERFRKLVSVAEMDDRMRLRYDGDEPVTLDVLPSDDGIARIEAITKLDDSVYTHLNAFCELKTIGHVRLALAFSPCPNAIVDVTFADYPFGKPARFAYLDANETFHVVQATSGEKGPFRELARGSLKRGEPLAITLLDDGKPFAHVRLLDFSTQASVQLSPTAGWGGTENAVEFWLANDDPTAPATISITLAGTSVGRGFDSVGHAPGVYRNRVEIERLK